MSIDGWDELVPEKRLKTWHELNEWKNFHRNIKIIITSRCVEANVWDSTNFLRIHPLSQVEALNLLRRMTGNNFEHEETVLRLIDVFNTPLMLKMLVTVTRQRGISLKESGENRDKLETPCVIRCGVLDENVTLPETVSPGRAGKRSTKGRMTLP